VGTAAGYLVDTETVLGVLPLGYLQRFSLGLPTDPVRAARLLVTGKISTIGAGRVVVPGQPARHFVHAATVGLNVSFAKLATQASLRRRFGRLTYAVAGIQALRAHESFDCELYYDGHHQHLRLAHLSVINAPEFGGFLGMRVRGANHPVADPTKAPPKTPGRGLLTPRSSATPMKASSARSTTDNTVSGRAPCSGDTSSHDRG
jgi:hypothetical protein